MSLQPGCVGGYNYLVSSENWKHQKVPKLLFLFYLCFFFFLWYFGALGNLKGLSSRLHMLPASEWLLEDYLCTVKAFFLFVEFLRTLHFVSCSVNRVGEFLKFWSNMVYVTWVLWPLLGLFYLNVKIFWLVLWIGR